jgi:FkbM family methyltransferase
MREARREAVRTEPRHHGIHAVMHKAGGMTPGPESRRVAPNAVLAVMQAVTTRAALSTSDQGAGQSRQVKRATSNRGRMITRVVKHALRSLGVDARRYTPQSSERAMMAKLLATYAVDCVFDVGANTGQYGRALRDMGFRSQIISFEPLSDAHARLVRNSRRDRRWVVAPAMALGDFDGETEIHVAGNLVSSSIREMTEAHEQAAPASKYAGKEKIKMQTLDSVFPAYAADFARPFLKIDTQGYESQVLDGAGSCLGHFVGVQAEMSLSELYQGQALLLDFALRMRQEGFQLAGLFPGFADNRTGRLLQVDGVFFR